MAITADHMTQLLEKARNACRPRLWAIWLAGLLGMAGCGHPPCQVDGKLGSCCAADEDCEGELTCLTRLPGGLCSRDCELDHLCPSEARCIHIVSKSKGDLGRACLKLCGSDLPACRPDYGCVKTSEPGVKVCFPG